MEKENYNRRDFLKSSLKTIAVGSIALSSLDIKKLFAEAETENASIGKTINLSDYPDLQSVGGHAIIGKTFISRTGDSKFLVLSMVCTHKKCDIDFTGDGFECPCHGSAFSSTGKVLNGPATKNLKSYKATYNAEANSLTF